MALTQVKTTGIADDAVTLAKQAGGTDGQIITYDASGNPVAVGPGNDGQVLTSTGAGSPPAFETLPASGATINNATENELVTVASTTTQLDAEANLTFDGDDLTVNKTSGDCDVIIQTTTSGDPTLKFNAAGAGGHNIAYDRADTALTFTTAGSSERMRIDAAGKVNIGTTASWLDKVTIKNDVAAGTHNWALHLLNGTHASDSRVGIAFQGNNETAANTWDGAGIYGANDGVTGACNMYLGTVVNGSFTERFKVGADGNATIPDGNLEVASGHGVSFGSTSDGTTMSSELFDDYEEGTWTPAIDGLDNTPSYYNLTGKYTKMGNVCRVQGFIQIGATKPSFTTTGNVFKVSGLPYAMSGVGYNGCIGHCAWQRIDWVGASRSTYGHADDCQLTSRVVDSTKTCFQTMGTAVYYMGQLFNLVFDDVDFILEWDMTYFTAT